jgi:hypothetical protein
MPLLSDWILNVKEKIGFCLLYEESYSQAPTWRYNEDVDEYCYALGQRAYPGVSSETILLLNAAFIRESMHHYH